MATPAHSLVRWIGGRCLRWFYREQIFVGRENIPSTGAVLLIGNHPNDLPDILLGYHSTARPVRYVGTISAASSPIAKATYQALGVIPVSRVRDARKLLEQGVDVSAVNDEAKREVARALAAGAVVGVYPEGGVHDEPQMAHFRSGVAQMALKCFENGLSVDVSVVPIGVHYDAPRRPRSDVTVTIGAPFSLKEWLSQHETVDGTQDSEARRQARRVVALRDRMRDALLGVTRNAASWDVAASRDRQAAIAGSLKSFAYEPLCNIGDIQMLADAVERAGGLQVSERDCARVFGALGVAGTQPRWPSPAFVVLAAPLALAGLAVHAPVWRFVWRRAQRTAVDRAEVVARTFVPGLYIVVGWYLALGLVLAVGWPRSLHRGWIAILIVMLFPVLGDVAMRWWDAIRAVRLRQRVRRWPLPERTKLREAALQVRGYRSPRPP